MAGSVSDQTFEAEVLKADLPVLVDFWAAWCGPCQAVAPVVEGVAQKFAGKLKVLKMNTDENPETPGSYGVMSIPALIMFKGGKEVARSVGYLPQAALEEKINKVL